MKKLVPFDPAYDIDAIAEIFRQEVAEAALRSIKAKRYRKASAEDQLQGMMAGMMVGALGCIAATIQAGSDAEIRAVLMKHFPYYFDRGLECNGREPLGEIN